MDWQPWRVVLIGKKTGHMMGVVLGRLSAKPVTVLYPYEKLETTKALRGKMVFDINTCISCKICARDCPSNAIRMEPREGHEKLFPVFYLDRCTFCGQCEESCPKDCIKLGTEFELAHLPGNDPKVE